MGPYIRAILMAYSKFKYSHELKIFLRALTGINNTRELRYNITPLN
jgi:hypothetical protein